jgi:hypothetical protein
MPSELPLRLLGRRDRAVSRGESDEERVAVAVHLVPLVGCERVPQQLPVLVESERVAVSPELLQEAS